MKAQIIYKGQLQVKADPTHLLMVLIEDRWYKIHKSYGFWEVIPMDCSNLLRKDPQHTLTDLISTLNDTMIMSYDTFDDFINKQKGLL